MTFIPLISKKEIKKRVASLAKEINVFFNKEEIIIIGVLKGSLFFMADLLKRLEIPFVYDFIQAKSYIGTESTENLKILKEPNVDLKDKIVLLIEDIVDTGITLEGIIRYLKKKEAKEIYICTLLDKAGRRKVDIKAHFIGFKIDNHFVVGYGLDIDEKFRSLEEIYILEPKI